MQTLSEVTMNTAIKVDNLSKKYIIGHQQHGRYLTLRETMAQKFKDAGKRLLHPFLSSSGQPLMSLSTTEELWALKDVSFEVQQGDRIGIIGRNGAGKTTLLKLLSRITEPTTGRISIKGRIASLLEVGTGFHPELSGRENIYLNGSILGMTKSEIKNKYDEIVEFAEIEKFLDTPVKRYSSGMYVRLAFAVAAHLEPEILIVDEVLAVGDTQFQKKCLGKMDYVSKHEGRTVLFVSHNMSAVSRLCESAILLDKGKLCTYGPVEKTVQTYMNRMFYDEDLPAINQDIIWKHDDLDVISFHACDESAKRKNYFTTSEHININIEYKIKKRLPGLRVGVDFMAHLDGDIIFRSFDDDLEEQDRTPGYRQVMCSIPPDLVKNGTYLIKLQIGIHNVKWICYDSIYDKLEVTLTDGVNKLYGDSRPGRIMPKIDWVYQNNHNEGS